MNLFISLKNHGLIPFIAITILFASGIGASAWTKQTLDTKQAEADEAARSAEVELVVINTPECPECFDIETELNVLQSLPMKITSRRTVDYPSDEAQQLIETYDIKRLPSAILTGETDKENVAAAMDRLGERRNDGVVWNSLNPIYLDTETGELRGKVTMTILTSAACPDCQGGERLVTNLQRAGVVPSSLQSFSASSAEGRELIDRYGIANLPAVLLSSEASLYGVIASSWQQIGRTADDGTLIADTPAAPYVRMSDGTIHGLVSYTVLTDTSCAECYNPSIYDQIMRNYGIAVTASSTVDIGSAHGAALQEAYAITSAPTLIISKDVSDYPAIAKVWNQVGTVESDGSYVLRSLRNFGTYRDLRTGTLVTPSSTNQ